ncbi:MAG: hypothetical protein V2I56_15450 [Desulfobacteraceae bacterium]|jgi:hypothetical protein|nr:hypothetical protein [Desulfobacteraceae bacterium]
MNVCVRDILDILGGDFLSTTDICKALEKPNFVFPNRFAVLLYCKGLQQKGAFVEQERTF